MDFVISSFNSDATMSHVFASRKRVLLSSYFVAVMFLILLASFSYFKCMLFFFLYFDVYPVFSDLNALFL